MLPDFNNDLLVGVQGAWRGLLNRCVIEALLVYLPDKQDQYLLGILSGSCGVSKRRCSKKAGGRSEKPGDGSKLSLPAG